MKDGEAIKCPICGKELGHYILEGTSYCKGIGAIPCYGMKMDYRKSSHHYSNVRTHRGHLCRSCAKKIFPEGKRYQVMVMHGSKPMAIFGGEEVTFYTTLQKAESRAKEMTQSRGYRYWVEERIL